MNAEIRSGDTEVHPEAIRREEEEREAKRQRQRELRVASWKLVGSTLLGLVSLYPIIRGTSTDNHTMMLTGFVIALISFKILPTESVIDIVDAWKGNRS